MSILNYIEKMKEMYEGPRITAQGPRIELAGGGWLWKLLYKGKPGLQHGAHYNRLMKQYRSQGMDLLKAGDKAMVEASEITRNKKIKIVQDQMAKTNYSDDTFVDLIDEYYRLTDYEMYKDIKRWDKTRPALADKTRALHFPDWAEARYGEDYHTVLERGQTREIQQSIDPNIKEPLSPADQMASDIDDMNKANLDELLEGRKKNAYGGRAGYNDGQLVTPSVDGSRPGYRGGDKKLLEGVARGAGKGIRIAGKWFGIPDAIFYYIDKQNMISKGMPEAEAAAQALENATFGLLKNKEYMKGLKKTAESMGIDARAFDDIYNLNVAGQKFDKYYVKAKEEIENLKELGYDKKADDAQKNLDRYIKEQNKNLGNLSQKVIDQVSISKAGGAASPLQLSKARDILTEDDFYKPFKDITKVAKEKLTREKRKTFPTRKSQVDTAAGTWGEGFYNVLDFLGQGFKNIALGSINPKLMKLSERQKEKKYLDEIGKKFIPYTKIPNPKYNPRELYLYNKYARNLTYDQPLTEADLMDLQAYQPGVFYSKGGRAGYMGGGITGIRRPNALPPTGGPQSGGLPSLYNNVRKW